ncbi:BTAD domain-containing putative transcriptional regulator [Dactylosporangium sucinum]|uniref:SARP family transcriptional regulator n=1 Tax=Dactylosporangium sucinum TaxID=1424081 RepID=A0A917U4W0_9ACTN|nr:BTAD domain-containing putative transcriptional regulator [Dactylosporangium sucinum]GGM55365.1 SARP family transcriptional regulator [Dactylosporangium sucinum]
MAQDGTGVVFRLLGPVEVDPPAALAPSVRPLLARLVLAAGRVVSVDTLTDALWGEDLPADAANALQIRVSKLRRALGPAGDLLVTRAPGYRLAVPPEAVDVHRFEAAVAGARAARDAGDAAGALRGIEAALAWWRGPALADAGDAEWVGRERHRLEELRLAAVEDRLELLLETGRPADAVADLERLGAEHPLRERPVRLLMLALYRSGRQADALDVHQALRRRLADELGLDPSPELRALAEAILRRQVPGGPSEPALAPVTAPALPARVTSLVGRDDDLTTVLDQLRTARVVTLTGPGGVGKTTLALEAARRAGGDVRLVRLAPLPAGADAAGAVAQQLGVPSDGAAADAAAAHLAAAPALLVLDNCEHVVDSAAALVDHLVHACPRVRVLATSREALAVAGEVQVAVAPLAVPDATRLFVDRARAVRPAFALDDDTAPAVEAVCRQLDGIPLAIELAAARVKALPPAEIAARLHDRFALLTGGPRTAEARHRTLRAVLDWSHDLLPEPERTLLRRLAVFRGGWTLPAAEDVCGFGALAPGDVLDPLFRLVDRSLVVPDPAGGRFRLLVTVQEYAAERLAEAGEAGECRDRHLDHYTRLGERLGPQVRAAGAAWAALRDDADNLRAAVDHALAPAAGDPDRGLRLGVALLPYWNYAQRDEGNQALTALLGAGGGAPALRAKALQGLGMLGVYYPTPASRAAARESLALFEELGDRVDAAVSRLVVAWEGQYTGDAEEYRALIHRSRAELADVDGGAWLATAEYLEGLLDLRIGAFDEAVPRWRQAETLFLGADDPMMAAASAAHLGVALHGAGRSGEAAGVLRRAADESRRLHSPHGLAFALVHLAHLRLDSGDDAVAPLLDEADAVARQARNPRCQAWAAWGRARIARARGDAPTAAAEAHRAQALLGEHEFAWALQRLRAFQPVTG